MPLVEEVAGVVQTWYPEQADGEALGAVLYGEDPGGRLPVTYGHGVEEYPVADERRYPGVDGRVHYEEGVSVGHCGSDRESVDPLFPFGHGQSCAAFEYDNLAVERVADGLDVSVRVGNVSNRSGREVAQAYMSPPETAADRPERKLGGSQLVQLVAGVTRPIAPSIPARAFARYDKRAGWTIDPGEYEVTVGQSSWADWSQNDSSSMDRYQGKLVSLA